MIISQKTKTVFFHNPRTGGNALSTELGVPQQTNYFQHTYPEVARKFFFQETWSDYWSFAFVRNPWDRYVSLYEHLHKTKNNIYPQSNSLGGFANQYPFGEWMYLCRNKFIDAECFGVSQTLWTDGVTQIFKFEEREAALPIISEKVNISLQNIKTNSSNKSFASYTDYYKKKDTIQIVRDIDKDTIERFGYKFGD